ncbi:MAG: nickel pincer cofactor biosynthesis protein LarC [Isosphaeraceae bacterium]|nr:nickel pincer cofactor biosynthesis protein LarC [Isosphaeraceae bacterium]
MRVAYFDCFSGISGDMTLGALVDAGVDPRALQAAVASLGLPCELTFETVRRGGFRAIHAQVKAPHEHAHRHLHHIEALIDKAALSIPQKELAKRIFRRLGEAEAAVHGVELRKIHFHEVGAIDSIVDIVGAAVGLDLLGVDRFEASPVPPGRGWVKAAHGKMPLPAPGTAELLKGVPLAESTADMEQTTPTGAAILTTVAEAFGPLPPMTIEAIGLGAGTRDLPGLANILRLFVGQVAQPAGSDRIWVLETNLDDLPGEVVGYATTQLLAAGALDAFVTPVLMKKNRPGVMITVLCDEASISRMEEILFRETTTLGVRRYTVSRHKLNRRAAEVETPFGPVRGKLGWLDGRPPTFSPEYDDCARVAAAYGVPLREVYQAAHNAFARSGPPPVPAPAPALGPGQEDEHDHDQGHGHVHDHEQEH